MHLDDVIIKSRQNTDSIPTCPKQSYIIFCLCFIWYSNPSCCFARKWSCWLWGYVNIFHFDVILFDRYLCWPSVIAIDWMPSTWAACIGSKMPNGITMYETSLSDNKLNSAQSLSPWRSVDCACSVTCIVCHPKVKSWNCTTSPRAQSAGHDQCPTEVGLHSSILRSNRPPPRRGSSCRPSSHHLACHFTSYDLYAG